MSDSDNINDQTLGSFVDGQLDAANCEQILEAMDRDPEVRAQVDNLRRTKDMMKLAFADAQAPSGNRPVSIARRWNPRLAALAASVMILVTGLIAGSGGYLYGSRSAGGSESLVASMAQFQRNHVILHISKSDREQFGAALAYTRQFLAEHGPQGGEIEVVANASGLDLLRAGVSPVEEEMIALLREHPNVSFYACANAMRALRKKGIEPVLITDVDTGLPAFDRIVGQLQDGWSYVKVANLPAI